MVGSDGRVTDGRGSSRRYKTKQSASLASGIPKAGWFTEGFDTANLKETKALLDELSRSVESLRPI